MRTLYLPNNLRKELRKIWGIPIFGSKKEVARKFKDFCLKKKVKKIITVGDYCSFTLPSDVKIFDGKVEREKITIPSKFLKGALRCDNPQGTIQKKVWKTLKKAVRNNKNVFVQGEEDLLVIPVVLLSEKNIIVVYGSPGKGICLIEVSAKAKKDFKELLNKFKSN